MKTKLPNLQCRTGNFSLRFYAVLSCDFILCFMIQAAAPLESLYDIENASKLSSYIVL